MDFTHSILGKTGIPVFRLGLSTSYWPGKQAVYKAVDAGMNLFFGFGIDRNMMSALREIMPGRRDQFVIATGPYNLIYGHTDIRKSLERRLRQLKTDYIDAFLFLGVMKGKEFPESVQEEMIRLREEGKVRAIGLSCHDRKFAGSLAADGAVDVLMVRYNAAHRGAEQDIFPHLSGFDPGVISYTATRWTYLIRQQKGWPAGEPIPTPGQCYRFVLSNPNVDVCLTAPSNVRQLEENLRALDDGPLAPEEMALMHRYGDLVHHTRKWFM